jgi:Outer membrane protein beta-barrel domain
MEKRLLLLFCVLLFAQAVFAQKEIGIKLGVTTNNIRADEGLEKYLEPAHYYSVGASVNFWLQKHFFLSTGVNYERTGSRTNDISYTDFSGNNLASGDVFEQLDYISIPVMLHYCFGKKNQFALGSGMFAAYLSGAHYEIKIDSGSLTSPTRNDFKKDYEDLNYGLLFNASYRIPIQTKWVLTLGAEDRLGLHNIKEVFPDGHYKTHSFGLYATFLFVLK